MLASPSEDALRLEPIERLEDAEEEWSRLAEAAGHPFATWDWNLRWWQTFGAGRELYCFACRRGDGEVAAILPLYVAATRPLRVARFLGYADWMTPICAPEDRPLAARALRDATRRGSGGCRLVLAERMPNEQGWGPLVGGPVISTHHDPVLRFDGMSWDEFLASRSKNFRDQVRRRERKIVRETGLSFRLADDPGRLTADIDSLFRLHSLRWGEETTGVFEDAGPDFHRAFAADALRRGWLRLWLAEIGGETVAAWYGWRFGGAEWYYQAGRDRRFDKLSLGFVLLSHTLREACNDGVAAYHFLLGDEEYKGRFTKEDPGSESRLVGPAAGGGAGALAIGLAGSLPNAARRRVMRISG
jgi:CelD/BcsL family acetyltransferase involved in cellulose biosynthesis